MTAISVPFVKEQLASIEEYALAMDRFEQHAIAFAPWPQYAYSPQVHFSIAHNGSNLLLKYYVVEKAIRAAVHIINGPVWEDTCVELFIGFDEKGYYNIECNCIGTPLIGFGKDRTERQLLDEAIVRQVERCAKIVSNSGPDIHWELTLQIPVSLFIHHNISSLQGTECGANFYKCGDALPQPHFLCWAPVEAPEPNFHLPQFFSRLLFQ